MTQTDLLFDIKNVISIFNIDTAFAIIGSGLFFGIGFWLALGLVSWLGK